MIRQLPSILVKWCGGKPVCLPGEDHNAAGAGSRSNCVSIGPQETSAPAQGLSGMGLGNNEG